MLLNFRFCMLLLKNSDFPQHDEIFCPHSHDLFFHPRDQVQTNSLSEGLIKDFQRALLFIHLLNISAKRKIRLCQNESFSTQSYISGNSPSYCLLQVSYSVRLPHFNECSAPAWSKYRVCTTGCFVSMNRN